MVETVRSSVDRRVLEEDRHVGGIRKRNTIRCGYKPKDVKLIACLRVGGKRGQYLI